MNKSWLQVPELAKNLTEKDMKKIMDTNLTFVDDLAKKGMKNFQSMLVLHTVKGNVIPTLFGDMPPNDVRHKAFEAIGKAVAEKVKEPLLCVAFLSEAWMAKADKDGKLPEGISFPLSESPIKEEVIIINLTAIDGRSSSAFLPFKRTKDNTMFFVESKRQVIIDDKDSKNYIMMHFWKGYLTEIQAMMKKG